MAQFRGSQALAAVPTQRRAEESVCEHSNLPAANEAHPEGSPKRTRSAHRLMEEYIDGSSAAFRELHALLIRPIRKRLSSIVRDRAEVEDLTQQVLLRIHLARHRYTPAPDGNDAALYAWVTTIARNLAFDHLRSSRTRVHRNSERLVAELESTDSPNEIVEQAESSRRAGIVRDAVAKLPTGQRLVVEGCKWDERSVRDVAASLGVREGAVRVRAHRAYRQLRVSLKDLLSESTSGGGARR